MSQLERLAAGRLKALPATIRAILERQAIGSDVSASGWARSLRRQKNVAFLELHDGSTSECLQIVLAPEEAEDIIAGTSVNVRGRLVKSLGRGQPVEVQADSVRILGPCGADYPIQKKEHGIDFLRQNAHFKTRTALFSSLGRIRSAAAQLFRNHLQDDGFVEVHAPVVTFADCEGAGESFAIEHGEKFFGSKAHLTVSSQLHGEIGAASLGRVYTFGPIFRAEKHHTSRHLAEFWMLEPEISFIDNLGALADYIEDMFLHVSRRLLDLCAKDFKAVLGHSECLEQRLEGLLSTRFERVQYSDAIKILQASKHTFTFPVRWGISLQSEHERFLAETVFKAPVFITDYPAEVKAFYMRANDVAVDPEGPTVACLDLVFPSIGEIVGGSLREERLEVLEAKMAAFGLDKEAYQWYLDLRRYGSVPHGGFGLGFERYLQYITGLSNIRDTSFIPRYHGTCDY